MEQSVSARRSFLSGLGTALAAVGLGTGRASAQSPASAAFRPTRHTQDDWLVKLPGKHRILIDAVTPKGAGEAVLYANNLYVTNKSAYSMDDKDLAIVIVMRHFATPFAYNDAAWAKYGKPIGGMLEFNDPKTKQPPTFNVYNSPDYGLTLPNLGSTIESVTKRGTVIAICDLATHFISQQLAAGGGNADAIYKDFTSNVLVPSSRFVSAGVVAVTRAQEHGYSLIYAG
jgi:hypothetical protein